MAAFTLSMMLGAAPASAQTMSATQQAGTKFSAEARGPFVQAQSRSSQPQENQAPPAGRSWFGRHPALTGALIGLGAGAPIGENCDFCALGAAAGAFAGLITSAVQTSAMRYSGPDGPDAAAVRRLVGRIGSGKRVVVKTFTSPEVRGKIRNIRGTDFDFQPDGDPSRVPIGYAEVAHIRAIVGDSTKVGIGVGAVTAGLITVTVVCVLSGTGRD
jgi:hypothetical protein